MAELRPVLGALLAAALSVSPLLARADYPIIEFAQTYAAPTSNFISNSFLNQEALINATRPGAARAAAAAPAAPLGPSQAERNAADLAAALPPAHRSAMAKIYVQVLPAYRQIEQQLGWPPDDVAGAMAGLIAGNYMVMTGTTLSNEVVSAAGNQLRASASVQGLIARLSPQERRKLYEQCAMLGTFMALAQQTAAQQSATVMANLRHSARENLSAVLGASAERVRFTAQGMRLVD